MNHPRGLILGFGPLLFAACEDKGGDSGALVELPEETDTVDLTGDSVALIPDTADDGLGDEEPEHWLSITQEGVWEMTPRGGPWTTMTGELVVTEILDEDIENPTCSLTYALTGEGVEAPGCETCDVAFLVSFYVSEGDPESCSDPDLPLQDEERTFGWSEVDSTIYLDYAGTGVWIPWYEGEIDEDTLTFTYSAELAKVVEEEDE